jgi:hypothetical protein
MAAVIRMVLLLKEARNELGFPVFGISGPTSGWLWTHYIRNQEYKREHEKKGL